MSVCVCVCLHSAVATDPSPIYSVATITTTAASTTCFLHLFVICLSLFLSFFQLDRHNDSWLIPLIKHFKIYEQNDWRCISNNSAPIYSFINAQLQSFPATVKCPVRSSGENHPLSLNWSEYYYVFTPTNYSHQPHFLNEELKNKKL